MILMIAIVITMLLITILIVAAITKIRIKVVMRL